MIKTVERPKNSKVVCSHVSSNKVHGSSGCTGHRWCDFASSLLRLTGLDSLHCPDFVRKDGLQSPVEEGGLSREVRVLTLYHGDLPSPMFLFHRCPKGRRVDDG